MATEILNRWLERIADELGQISQVDEAWVFGSRARGDNGEDSDLDIAVKLNSENCDAAAAWIFNGKRWESSIQSSLGNRPVIHLEFMDEADDQIVWPAVMRDGFQFYNKANY